LPKKFLRYNKAMIANIFKITAARVWTIVGIAIGAALFTFGSSIATQLGLCPAVM
jgi:hypothetical protein